MIERGLIITGSDADLLSRALLEVKTKAYEESEAQLDDSQALSALVSGFRSADSDEPEKESRQSNFSPLRKRLVLGTIIERQIARKVTRPNRSRFMLVSVDLKCKFCSSGVT